MGVGLQLNGGPEWGSQCWEKAISLQPNSIVATHASSVVKDIESAAVHCQLNNSVRNLAKYLLTTTSALENHIHTMMDDPTLLMSYKIFLHNIKWSRLLCCEKTIKPQSRVMTEKTGAIKEISTSSAALIVYKELKKGL